MTMTCIIACGSLRPTGKLTTHHCMHACIPSLPTLFPNPLITKPPSVVLALRLEETRPSRESPFGLFGWDDQINIFASKNLLTTLCMRVRISSVCEYSTSPLSNPPSYSHHLRPIWAALASPLPPLEPTVICCCTLGSKLRELLICITGLPPWPRTSFKLVAGEMNGTSVAQPEQRSCPHFYNNAFASILFTGVKTSASSLKHMAPCCLHIIPSAPGRPTVLEFCP